MTNPVMSDPFSHDTTSNAVTDHSFARDVGVVPTDHLVSFAKAMDAPNSSLAEEDYRFPGGSPPTAADRSAPIPAAGPDAETRPGYYPKGYAP